ncbi:MAG: hypothetical protein K9G41_01240 [Flavobacteriales bacterium]|nr:hypothetical protein [Flavobacteriales bacterium]
MRTVLFLLVMSISTQVHGQAVNDLYKPTTLEEAFVYLDDMFDDTSKYTFMVFPEDEATGRLHHGLGTYIRNNWGLWGNSSLKQHFESLGVHHPDNMSGMILTSYHRRLNHKPIDIEGQTAESERFSQFMQQAYNNQSNQYKVGQLVYHDFNRLTWFFGEVSSSPRVTAEIIERDGDQVLLSIREYSDTLKPIRYNGYKLEVGTEHWDKYQYWRLPIDTTYINPLKEEMPRIQETAKPLSEYFSVGDTIVVSVYAEKQGFLQKFGSSVRAIAVVLERKDSDLLIQIIKIHQERNRKPERQVGEIFEVNPIYCSLIPPKGWVWK